MSKFGRMALVLTATALGLASPLGWAQGANPALPGAAPASDADAKAKAAALAAKSNIDVNDGWVRAAANGASADVFLRIESVGKQPDKLVGAETSNAAKVVLVDAPATAAKGAAPAGFDIPGGGVMTFAPGGKHVSLQGLKAPLREGESFLITLIFEKAGHEEAVVKVLGAQATGLPAVAPKKDTTSGVTK